MISELPPMPMNYLDPCREASPTFEMLLLDRKFSTYLGPSLSVLHEKMPSVACRAGSYRETSKRLAWWPVFQTLAILIITGGALGRSLYTGWRIIQSAARGTERPWIALGVGALPFVGNLAFPTQMFYSAGGKGQKLARFMLEDGFTRIGRHFPIWGGQDTWTEHAFNLLPGNIIRYWVRLRRRF